MKAPDPGRIREDAIIVSELDVDDEPEGLALCRLLFKKYGSSRAEPAEPGAERRKNQDRWHAVTGHQYRKKRLPSFLP